MGRKVEGGERGDEARGGRGGGGIENLVLVDL